MQNVQRWSQPRWMGTHALMRDGQLEKGEAGFRRRVGIEDGQRAGPLSGR
jgi:hypothetical protein